MPLVLVIGGAVAFSLLIEHTSLILAVLAVTVCASLAGRRLNLVQVLAIFVVLSVHPGTS